MVIQGIKAAVWAIPPSIIFAGHHHLSAWYEEKLPRYWAIVVSDDGWTTKEIGVEWVKNIIKQTEGKVVGARWLLILDGHESHYSLEFQELCLENNLHTLCMHTLSLVSPVAAAWPWLLLAVEARVQPRDRGADPPPHQPYHEA